MHTSTRLHNSDFRFYSLVDDRSVSIPFSAFCPDYHEQDRVGVVSPTINYGVHKVGRAILALTTAFYDAQRAKADDFFDYPQHFAFVSLDSIDHEIDENQLWGAWSWLDVWPNNKWIAVPPTATGMLKAVFDYQINRLFWPSDLLPEPNENPLPDYVYRMLRTRLKGIYCYGDLDARLASGRANMKIAGDAPVSQLIEESVKKLPERTADIHLEGEEGADYLQFVSGEEFLRRMGLNTG